MNDNELKKLIELAENGDIKAIMSLGRYYMTSDETHNIDIDESLKWYTIGAEMGNTLGMILAANTGAMKAHALRCIYGNPDYNEIVNLLTSSLAWVETALKFGFDTEEADNTIIFIQYELGIAYYFLSLQDTSKPKELLLEKAIDCLKACYQKPNRYEASIYLGFAMIDYKNCCNKLTIEDEFLAHSLLMDCVNHHFNEYKMSAFAAMYLGLMYIDGVGCSRDYDMAVYYLQKAQDAGQDCSDILCRFKKTLFGGYKFI